MTLYRYIARGSVHREHKVEVAWKSGSAGKKVCDAVQRWLDCPDSRASKCEHSEDVLELFAELRKLLEP